MVVQPRSSAARGGGNSLPTMDAEPRTFATNNGRKRKQEEEQLLNDEDLLGEVEEEPIEKLLQALKNDSLAILVKEAVSKYGDPDYLKSIRKVADVDPALRKIRVEVSGNVHFNPDILASVFGKYGEIEQFCFVGNGGAGFSPLASTQADILFKHRYGAREVLRTPHIDIRKHGFVTCKLQSLIGKFNKLTFSPGYSVHGGHQSLLEVKEPEEKLVDFFGKNYLVGLVMEAISKHPDFIHSVEKLASLDPTPRQVWVFCKNLPFSLGSLTSFRRDRGVHR